MLAWAVWNVFLASLPLFLGRALGARLSPSAGDRAWRAPSTLALAAGWLLLLPNAPYLLTEVRHFVLDPTWRSLTGAASRDPAALRASAAFGGLFLLYGAVGIVCFTAALRPVEASLRARGVSIAWFRVALFPLVALGVWLGLVPRLNSWDALVRPDLVLRCAAWATTHASTLACLLGFAAALAALHALLDAAWAGRRWTAAAGGPSRG